ncbi:MAG TPA: DUF3995 domain-containing protein [Thermomicrobiales bacterium]|nr:DUF3995 domain-containing protein [Thermomicrobiales bacterium]
MAAIARQIEYVPLANDPLVVAATGVAQVAAGRLPLALGKTRPGGVTERMLRAAVAIAGFGFALYGVANLVDHGLMVAGLRPTTAALGSSAAHWHLLFRDPFWILGAALFLAERRADEP